MNRRANNIRLGFCLFITTSVLAGPSLPPETALAPERLEVKSKPRPKTWQKFNPIWWFGNIDDPTPPAWYRPDDKHRRMKWRWRNPLHNFTFYVVGIADKDFKRAGKHPEAVFNPNNGWNTAVCKYRFLRLPFVSYKSGKFKFYFGWRERGNLGFKLAR